MKQSNNVIEAFKDWVKNYPAMDKKELLSIIRHEKGRIIGYSLSVQDDIYYIQFILSEDRCITTTHTDLYVGEIFEDAYDVFLGVSSCVSLGYYER